LLQPYGIDLPTGGLPIPRPLMMTIAGRLLEIAKRNARISMGCREVDWDQLGTESVSAIVSRLAAAAIDEGYRWTRH
jgi:hypothetical protein